MTMNNTYWLEPVIWWQMGKLASMNLIAPDWLIDRVAALECVSGVEPCYLPLNGCFVPAAQVWVKPDVECDPAWNAVMATLEAGRLLDEMLGMVDLSMLDVPLVGGEG